MSPRSKFCRHIGDYESHGSPTIKILPPTTVSLSLTNFNLDIFQYNFRRCPGMWNDSIKWFNRWYRLYAFPLKKNPFRVLTDFVSVCIANWSDKRKDPWFSSSSLSKCCWPDRIWRWNWRKAYELTRNKFAIFICLEKKIKFSKQKWCEGVKFRFIYGIYSDENGNDSCFPLRLMRFPKEKMLREFPSSHASETPSVTESSLSKFWRRVLL